MVWEQPKQRVFKGAERGAVFRVQDRALLLPELLQHPGGAESMG